jgi:hypothetical protein
MREIVSAMRVVEAMDRSCDSGVRETVAAEEATAGERRPEGAGA